MEIGWIFDRPSTYWAPMRHTPKVHKDVSTRARAALDAAGAEITSLTLQAYERLQELLITLELKPGMLLSELQLAELLGLGRSPVREAVQRLAREGLLDVHRARGIVVAPLNPIRQLQFLDVRRPLEYLVGIRASRNASPEQRAEMLVIAQRFIETAAAADGLGFLHTIRRAHLIKVEAADNEILQGVMGLFSGLSIRFWYANYRRQRGSLEGAGDIHAALLKSIVAFDEREVGRLSDELIDYLEAFTRRLIG